MSLIQQHLDKLPLTAQALAEEAETREGYAVRRIQQVLMQCQQEHIFPKRWQLIRWAGVDRLKDEPLVKQALEDVLQEYKANSI